jgi:hypothetical protein
MSSHLLIGHRENLFINFLLLLHREAFYFVSAAAFTFMRGSTFNK